MAQDIRHFPLFSFIILILASCQGSENQVFMPEINSQPEVTAEIFVPAVQSGSDLQTAEPTMVVQEDVNKGPTSTSVTGKEAADADVLFVRANHDDDGSWTFSVTVAHPDTGWDDYADGWDVVLEDGTVVKPDEDSQFTRLLLHPHENEQPFTRSQGGIEIPQGITQVAVRAHDIVDGYGGKEIIVDLMKESGPGFEVHRKK